MKIMFYVILALVCGIGVLFLVVKHLSGEIKLLKTQLETSEKEKDSYARQVQRLTSTAGIIAANEREANEKIDEIYSGDAVDNALSGLSKHKN